MSAPFRAAWATSLTLAALLVSPFRISAQEDAPPPVKVPKMDDGITILARGPIHEAFAQPTDARPEPSLLVPKKPPAMVPEVPPDQKPKAENAIWIPGYWAWDVERKDFLWVSGVWRIPPPGRRWVPGRWHQADNGWQWISGLWAPGVQDNFRLLSEPPNTLDNGPSSPRPDADSSYIPGSWVPRDGSYAWRPGFWNNNYSEWIWNPDGYYWTPGGYIFNPGYWDYNLEDRGLIFAPAYFNQPFWNTPGWSYTPNYCIGFPGLFGSLFYGPNNWLWFGNYYGPFWRGWGYRPWCFGNRAFGNSLWNHYAWRNRFNPGWAGAQQSLAAARFNGRAPVPANTLAGQNAANGSQLNTVTHLNQMGSQTPLTRLTPSQQNQVRAATANQQATPRIYSGNVTNRPVNPGASMPRSAADYFGRGLPAYQQPAYRNAMPGGYRSGYRGGIPGGRGGRR